MFEMGTGITRIDNPEVIKLVKNIDLAVAESAEIVVYNQETLNTASKYISGFSSITKRLEEFRKIQVGPLNQEVKEINATYKELNLKYATEEARLSTQVKAFMKVQQETAEREAAEERKRREEQAMQDAIAKETRMKAEAAAKGEDPSKVVVEVAIVPEVIEETTKLKDMNSSGLGTMKVAKWEIIDVNLIPREYLIVDEKKIGAIRKGAGVDAQSSIPGIRYFFETTLVKR